MLNYFRSLDFGRCSPMRQCTVWDLNETGFFENNVTFTCMLDSGCIAAYSISNRFDGLCNTGEWEHAAYGGNIHY